MYFFIYFYVYFYFFLYYFYVCFYFYDKSKQTSTTGKNPLNPELNFEKSYMTDLLQAMINDQLKIKAIPVHNSWLELDSYDDFKLYTQMYENKSLGKFFNILN